VTNEGLSSVNGARGLKGTNLEYIIFVTSNQLCIYDVLGVRFVVTPKPPSKKETIRLWRPNELERR
jgi:hypothetical protein